MDRCIAILLVSLVSMITLSPVYASGSEDAVSERMDRIERHLDGLIRALPVPADAADKPLPEKARLVLAEGNQRYSSGKSTFPNLSAGRMAETAENGQYPFATVINCSDSRVPVEMVFDQGIGDIFTIRVAGNVCDVDEVGSIEYGVDHLETPVFVVLGHTHCGAVIAVVTDAELHGSIPALVDNIRPAVEKARREHHGLEGTDLVPEAVKANVWQSIEDLLRTSPATRDRVRDGRVMAVGAVYHLDTGRVEWLGTHTHQDDLLNRYADSGGGHGH